MSWASIVFKILSFPVPDDYGTQFVDKVGTVDPDVYSSMEGVQVST